MPDTRPSQRPGLRQRMTQRLAGSRLIVNTGVMAAGTGGRLLLQIALFVIVARLLGPESFGAFVGITALVAIVSAFAGLSCEVLLVRSVARDPDSFAAGFGHGLMLLALTTPILTGFVLAVAPLIGGTAIDPLTICIIAIGDLFFLRVSLLCAACYQATEKVAKSAAINIGFSACRLAAAGIAFAAVERLDIATWGIFYAAGAGVAAAFSLAWVIRDRGWPKFVIRWRDLGFGAQASLQSMLYFTLRDIDKPLLTRLASLEATGLYAAAFRIADAAVIPIRSLMYAAYASFFRHGQGGARGSLRFALRILPLATAYAILAGIGILLAPDALPWLLGAEYAEAGEILRYLAALPLLHAAYNIAADALTASGHQSSRTASHAVAAACMLIACTLLIPRYGAVGAAMANIGSHALLAAMSWALLGWHQLRSSAVPLVAEPLSAKP